MIALRQNEVPAFLQELETRMAGWHWSLAERIEAWAVIQAPDQFLAAIGEEVAKGGPDRALDELCFLQLLDLARMSDRPDFQGKIVVARVGLRDRLKADERFLARIGLDEAFALDPRLEASVAPRKEAVAAGLRLLDRHKLSDLTIAIDLSARVGDLAGIRAGVADALAIPGSAGSSATHAQLYDLLPAILQFPGGDSHRDDAARIPEVILQVLRPTFPATLPPPALAVAGARDFPPPFPAPNRFFAADDLTKLGAMFQRLRSLGQVDAMMSALAKEGDRLGDWRRIYPDLIRVYGLWATGDRAGAVNAMDSLQASESDTDLAFAEAAMYFNLPQRDLRDGIDTLYAIVPRSGPEFITQQMLSLRAAIANQEWGTGQTAALQLMNAHLSAREESSLVNDYYNVGFVAKSNEIAARSNRPATTTVRLASIANRVVAPQAHGSATCRWRCSMTARAASRIAPGPRRSRARRSATIPWPWIRPPPSETSGSRPWMP